MAMGILNSILLFYVIPLILCYLLARYSYKNGGAVDGVDVFLIFVPFMNWVMTCIFLAIAIDKWIKSMNRSHRNFLDRFFRIKD